MSLFETLEQYSREHSINVRWAQFHSEHPEVYVELVRLARQAKAVGRQRIGVRMLWEVMRWNFALQRGSTEDEFKLNDHYPSRYARLIMRSEPDLAEIFEVRELRS